ncbi:MAG TPA: molybdopterin molybdotransferase MoeA [Chloroflexaceae bacterium]|nr:molybdopterin molybdotransferase MoeA [Chloroflexaceae bacterium]
MPELFQVVTVAEAGARLGPHLAPLGRAEELPLHAALGRALAADMRAPGDLPAFPRSTMDGFAVRAADTYGASEGLPAYLALCGEVPMGRPAGLAVGPGQAARVHTGGMLPSGADAVVMVEHTQALDATTIEVVRPVAVGEHVIPVGEDVRAGELLFPRGHRLRPQDLGGLAGVGLHTVPVAARPRVAILASGDEVVPADAAPGPGQVRDINTYTIAALTARAGGEPCPYGIAPDDLAALRAMAEAALAQADVLVISAGSSVSTRDMTAEAIASLGPPGVLVHGVAMHPGKPTILAVAGGRPVFGLPGNPVSAMIAFELFVAPALRRLQGAPEPALAAATARLGLNIASRPGREDFVPVRLARRDGELWAEPVFGKSNLIYTMARADGLVRVPLDLAGLYAGDLVEVSLF